MAKKKRISYAAGEAKQEKPRSIVDKIPKYSQQRRGPPPKRRSDFSFFSSSSSSSSSASPPSSMSSSDYLPRFSNCKDGLSNVAAVSSDEAKDKGSPSLALTPVKRCNSWIMVTPSKFQGTETSDVGMTPSSFVFERTDFEVLSTAEPQASNEDHANQSRQSSSPDEANNLDRAGGCFISISRKIADDSSEKGRGKRKRKPRSFFSDDLYSTSRSPNKVRRYRIMRYLGLMAPVGSPYSVNN